MKGRSAFCVLWLGACMAGTGDGTADAFDFGAMPTVSGAPQVTFTPSVLRDGQRWGRAGAVITVTADVELPTGADAIHVTLGGAPLVRSEDGVWTRTLDGTEGEGIRTLSIQAVRGEWVSDPASHGEVALGFDFTAPTASCVLSPETSNTEDAVTLSATVSERLDGSPTVTPSDLGINIEPLDVDGREARWSVEFPANTNLGFYQLEVSGTDEVGNAPADGVLCAVGGSHFGAAPRLDGDVLVEGTPSYDDDGTPVVRTGAEVVVTIPLANGPVDPSGSAVSLSGTDLVHVASTADETVWSRSIDGTEGDGLKALDALLVDGGGNALQVQQPGVVRFDSTPPLATCRLTPTVANASDSVSFEVVAAEPLATAPVVSPDASEVVAGAPAASGSTYTFPLTASGDVDYVLDVALTDLAGNTSSDPCPVAHRTGSFITSGPMLTGDPTIQVVPSVEVDGTPWARSGADIRVVLPTAQPIDEAASTVSLGDLDLGWDPTNSWWSGRLDGTEGDGLADLDALLRDAAGNVLVVEEPDVVGFDFTAPTGWCQITPSASNAAQVVWFEVVPAEPLATAPIVASPSVSLAAPTAFGPYRWEVLPPPNTNTSFVLSIEATDRVGNTSADQAFCPASERTGRHVGVAPTLSGDPVITAVPSTSPGGLLTAGAGATVTVELSTTSAIDAQQTSVELGVYPLVHSGGLVWTRTLDGTEYEGIKDLFVEMVDDVGNRTTVTRQAVIRFDFGS